MRANALRDEDRDAGPDVSPEEELAGEIRLYEAWQQQQDDARWHANYHRYLASDRAATGGLTR